MIENGRIFLMRGGIWMHTKLSIPERLKDLRVVDKHLTLEQLAELRTPGQNYTLTVGSPTL